MNTKIFFQKFDQVAEMPNAVAKMREIVLEMAVRGGLNGANSSCADWPLEQLKNLTSKIGSGSTPAGGRESYKLQGTPLIRSMNIHFRKFLRDGLAFIDDLQAAKLNNVIVEPNDVLLNITGASIGRVTTALPTRSKAEGERSEGLHKRSAEDWGCPCHRAGGSAH